MYPMFGRWCETLGKKKENLQLSYLLFGIKASDKDFNQKSPKNLFQLKVPANTKCVQLGAATQTVTLETWCCVSGSRWSFHSDIFFASRSLKPPELCLDYRMQFKEVKIMKALMNINQPARPCLSPTHGWRWRSSSAPYWTSSNKQ